MYRESSMFSLRILQFYLTKDAFLLPILYLEVQIVARFVYSFWYHMYISPRPKFWYFLFNMQRKTCGKKDISNGKFLRPNGILIRLQTNSISISFYRCIPWIILGSSYRYTRRVSPFFSSILGTSKVSESNLVPSTQFQILLPAVDWDKATTIWRKALF